MTTERGHTLDMAGAGAPVPATTFDPTVEVPCHCPGQPHAHDTVTLRTSVTVPMGFAAMTAMRNNAMQGGTPDDALGALASVYLHYGIAAWSFVDEKGKPVPITPVNADRLLPFDEGGFEVADRADDILQAEIVRPLVRRTSTLSPDTQTPDSTSASPDQTAPSTPEASSWPAKPEPPSVPSSPGTPDGTPFEDPAP